MKTFLAVSSAVLISSALSVTAPPALGQASATPLAQAGPAAPTLPHDTILVTLFLHHDQTKTFAAIKQQERETGFDKAFPPAGVEVVSWDIVMGQGQEIRLKLPPEKLRELLGVVERCTYGVYKSDWYISYDYKAIWEANKAKAAAAAATGKQTP